MDARRDTVSQLCGENQDAGSIIFNETYFQPVFGCFSLSIFIFPAPYRSDRLGCALWNLNAGIMPDNTQSGYTLVAWDSNIKQRTRLPSIEILVEP